MSFDVFFQHVPEGLVSVDEFSEDFEPRDMGERAEVIAALQRAAGNVRIDFDAKGRAEIAGQNFLIAVSILDDDPVQCVACFVHGGIGACRVLGAISQELGVPGLGGGSRGVSRTEQEFAAAMGIWIDYRDQVLGTAQQDAGRVDTDDRASHTGD